MSSNGLGVTGMRGLLSVLHECKVLHALKLRRTQMLLEGSVVLAKFLLRCDSFTALNIAFCEIGGFGMEVLGECLSARTNLRILTLSDNAKGGDSAAFAATAVWALLQCTEIEQADMTFTGLDENVAVKLVACCRVVVSICYEMSGPDTSIQS